MQQRQAFISSARQDYETYFSFILLFHVTFSREAISITFMRAKKSKTSPPSTSPSETFIFLQEHVQSVVQRLKIFCLSDISPASVFSYVITPWFIHRIGLISLKARHDKHLVLCFLCTKSNMISLPPYIIR